MVRMECRQLTRQNYQASTRHGCTNMVCCQDTSGEGLVFRPVSLTLDSTGRQQSCNFHYSLYWKSSRFQRLVVTLRDSRDQLIRQAGIETRTGRKWSASQAIEQAQIEAQGHRWNPMRGQNGSRKQQAE